jgi:nucleotide-binding universal stress UspA family protein
MERRTNHVRIESTVMEGDPVEMILRAAEETNSDVIVMGTHGRTGLRRLLMGSVAEGVGRKAPCSVLTARAPRTADSAALLAAEETART